MSNRNKGVGTESKSSLDSAASNIASTAWYLILYWSHLHQGQSEIEKVQCLQLIYDSVFDRIEDNEVLEQLFLYSDRRALA